MVECTPELIVRQAALIGAVGSASWVLGKVSVLLLSELKEERRRLADGSPPLNQISEAREPKFWWAHSIPVLLGAVVVAVAHPTVPCFGPTHFFVFGMMAQALILQALPAALEPFKGARKVEPS